MKCKICGHRANTIQSMAAHYRSKHPSKMEKKKHKKSSGDEKVNKILREIREILDRR